MFRWNYHGAMCAGALLAYQGAAPLLAEAPRPIPLATSAGDPRYPASTRSTAPVQSKPSFSLWADVLGLSSPPTATLPTQPSAPRAPSLPVSQAVHWEILGRSVEGRVIEFAQFGEGPHQVLVVGALDGDKPEGVAMAEYLAAHLTRFPKRTGDVTVTIVRDPNPDGRSRRTPANARGVLLDRNFNTAGWQRRGVVTGPESESEPEVRALAELLIDLQPDRVVIFGSAAGKSTLGAVGPDLVLAKQVALEAAAQMLSQESMRIPGSLASYTGDDRGIPTLKINFVPAANADAIWSDHKRAILTAIGCGSPLDFIPIATRYGPRKPRQATGVAVSPTPQTIGNTPTADAAELSHAVPAVVNPTVIRFESLKQGLPTVAIQRSRIRQTSESAFDEWRPDLNLSSSQLATPSIAPQVLAPMVPLTPQITSPESPATTAVATYPSGSILQRLPPVEPSAAQYARPNLTPSRPLVSYPQTGK